MHCSDCLSVHCIAVGRHADRQACWPVKRKRTSGGGGGGDGLQLQQGNLLGGQLKAGLLHGAQDGLALQQGLLSGGRGRSGRKGLAGLARVGARHCQQQQGAQTDGAGGLRALQQL